MNMIDYEIFDAKVDRFLRHAMNSEEELDFKAELASSPELMSRAKTIALTIKGMKKIRAEKDAHIVSAIKGMSESEFRKIAGVRPKKIRLWPKVMNFVAAACIISVCSVLGLKMYKTSLYKELATSEQYMAYASDFNGEGTFRGALDSDAAKDLSRLFENSKKGEDLSSTIESLETLYRQSKDESSDLYDFRDDVAWNLVFAYIQNGDGDKAIPVLQEMLQRNKEWSSISKPLEELLIKLQNI